MEVHFTPEIQARLDRLSAESGRPRDALVQDAMHGYLDELEQARGMLDSRYDDLKNGRVIAIPGDEVAAHFRDKRAAARRPPPGS